MNRTEPSRRCAHCGAAHPSTVHARADDARLAAAVAELEGLDEAPTLRRHARNLALRERLRASGYAPRVVYELNALLARAA